MADATVWLVFVGDACLPGTRTNASSKNDCA